MPPPREMLSATEKDGSTLEAAEIYEETWNWLNERDCAHLIMPQLLERYAMSAARWMQCEAAVTEFGFLAKHPTTGNAMQSPRSEEHTSELQSRGHLVCRLLLEKKN